MYLRITYLQAEPGATDPAPPGQLPPVLSPSQPLPPPDAMKGISDITADDQVSKCSIIVYIHVCTCTVPV